MQRPIEIHIRISTIFLVLAMCCYYLSGYIHFPGAYAAHEFLASTFGLAFSNVVLGDLGPIYALIGAIVAIGYLIAYRKKPIAVLQLYLELVLSIFMAVAFPAY